MILFNNKYKIELEISQGDFIDRLLIITEIRPDLSNDIFPNKQKEFLGRIDFNSFEITFNKSVFSHNNCHITGKIAEEGDKAQITGFIKGYKYPLIFNFIFTIVSLVFLIHYIFYEKTTLDLIFFSLFSLVGILNFFGAIYYQNKNKKTFIDKIQSFS